MTYLDPNHARAQADWGKWIVRALVVAAIALLGWLALTIGNEGGRPATPVQETVSRAF